MKSCRACWAFLSAPPVWAPTLRRAAQPRLLLLAGVLAALLNLGISWFQTPLLAMDEVQMEAARTSQVAAHVIKALREARGIALDSALDPALSGLIGADFTDLTSTLGALGAKQTSLNPDFAALLVHWLREAGVKPGDTVAVALTGSFPALNIATLSACQALDLKPRIISSVGASSYGANIAGLCWADMEAALRRAGVFPYKSLAMSLGGIVDNNGGLDGTGMDVGIKAIRQAETAYLPEGEAGGLERDMERRQAMFFAAGKPAAFINVGGAITSLGWVPEAALLENGLARRFPPVSSGSRGLIFRMHEEGVPVIHLLNIERLAAKFGLPQCPAPLPEPGRGLGAELRSVLMEMAGLIAVWALISFLALPGRQRKE